MICNMVKASFNLENIRESSFSKKLIEIERLNSMGEDIISLGTGSPDLPPHVEVVKTLNTYANAANTHKNGNTKGSLALREAISKYYKEWYKVTLDPKTEILPLIGSKEGIVLVCLSLLNVGDFALVPSPCYPTYNSAVELSGAKVIEYALTEDNDYYPDFELLNKMDLKRVKLMFVNYPNMPTGQLPNNALFNNLIQFANKNQILICYDNPYSFILTDQPVSLLSAPNAKENVIELNTLSKSHNMSGWRVGMLSGFGEAITQVTKFKSILDSGIFMPIQMAAVKALALDRSWYESLNEIYRARRNRIFELLRLLGCSYSTNRAGLFVWAKIPESFIDADDFSNYVLSKVKIFVIPGSAFGERKSRHVRVSLCVADELIEECISRAQLFKTI